MKVQELETLLKKHGLRRTDIRLQVLGAFQHQDMAYSQQDLQQAVGEIDRVTLYRTLRSFEDKGLIHRAIDGTDQAKYALCQEACTTHEHKDDHAHFHCTNCGRTICIEEKQVPSLDLPNGFQAEEAQIVLRGVCDQCSQQ